MPELPDVEIFKQEAEKALHKRIDNVEIKDSDFVQATQQEFEKHVIGNELQEVWRKGKYLFLETGNQSTVVLHFGMTGLLKYAPETEEPTRYVKLTLELDNKNHLHYICKRKLGSIEITGDSGKYTDQLDLGTDAFQIGEDEFKEKLKASQATIKSFLMDQSTISGIGNVYSDEMLYQSGIPPTIKSSKLSGKKIRRLYKKMKRVLKMAIDKEADVSQMPKTWLLPNRVEGGDCPRCDGKIKKVRVSGRTAYYCPSCQQK